LPFFLYYQNLIWTLANLRFDIENKSLQAARNREHHHSRRFQLGNSFLVATSLSYQVFLALSRDLHL
ncbi:MAG: hypothetical protein ACREPR_09115, partial [Brasilonema sp.]